MKKNNAIKKQNELVKKMSFKEKLIHLWKHIKRPAFIIPTIVTWILLESPLIVSMIIYFINKDPKYLAVAGGWYALTVAPLPIPVLPISLAVGTAFERLIFTGKKKALKEKEKEEKDKLGEQDKIVETKTEIK